MSSVRILAIELAVVIEIFCGFPQLQRQQLGYYVHYGTAGLIQTFSISSV